MHSIKYIVYSSSHNICISMYAYGYKFSCGLVEYIDIIEWLGFFLHNVKYCTETIRKKGYEEH